MEDLPTCLVMRVAPDGLVTVANAGSSFSLLRHPAELELKNGLPLGLAANSTYPETQFQLGLDEQMTMMTDGVIEARGRDRQLYGFERAAAIAETALGGVDWEGCPGVWAGG